MSKLADYLAKNYLTADRAPDSSKKKSSSSANTSTSSKKRKRKGATADAAGGVTIATSGLVIADDDTLDWGDVNRKQMNGEDAGLVDGMYEYIFWSRTFNAIKFSGQHKILRLYCFFFFVVRD